MRVKSYKILLLLSVICNVFCQIGCKSKTDEPAAVQDEHETIQVKGEIRANTLWTANNRYVLKGYVYVTNQATLTIEPGTVIYGGSLKLQNDSQPDALIVEAGAKIMAIGTVQSPIVFTSGKSAGTRNYGDWGGLVLIGKARHNRPGNVSFDAGIRGSLNTFNESADNSGSLQYVRIEYAGGSACCTDLSGLRCYGVGSKTLIDHVQVSYSAGDSFEWRGGTVNASHLVSLRAYDDDFDIDWGYTGNVQFALSLRDPEFADASGSNCIESDNFNPGENQTQPEPNDGFPVTQAVLANFSGFAFSGLPVSSIVKGSGGYQSAMHLRRNSATSIINSVFTGWPEGLRLGGTLSGTWANVENGSLDLQGVTLANTGGAVPLFGTALTLDVRGEGQITDQQAQGFFRTVSKKNETIALANISSLLLNPSTFDLNAPKLVLQNNSELLTTAISSNKLANSFFVKTSYKGAFGSKDWTQGWVSWQPQMAGY